MRFGADVPKQYLPLAGDTLIAHTLRRLANHPRIAGLVLVLAADDQRWEGISQIDGKPLLTTVGGAQRADSVLAGLRVLPDSVAADAFVLVHDAARPCVRAQDITRLLVLGVPAGGGLLGAPLRDTLKQVDADGRSSGTESRDARWRAFTPQMFRRNELIAALIDAQAEQIAITDEAMAMEYAGFAPLLVEGAEDNIKVTTPADLVLAEFLLQKMGE